MFMLYNKRDLLMQPFKMMPLMGSCLVLLHQSKQSTMKANYIFFLRPLNSFSSISWVKKFLRLNFSFALFKGVTTNFKYSTFHSRVKIQFWSCLCCRFFFCYISVFIINFKFSFECNLLLFN